MAMADEHREFLELLPWYVNGTLADGERADLECHLHECLPCNAALKEERRLSDKIQNQDSVPIGPEHGINELLQEIDRSEGRRGFSVGLPALGYGLAAAFGGAIVWAFVAFSSGPNSADGEFSTLSAGTPSATSRIDIVFFDEPSPIELERFIADFGGVLVSGPSDLGRYTVALESRSESSLNEILATLRTDPQIQFAGRSFIAESAEAREDP